MQLSVKLIIGGAIMVVGTFLVGFLGFQTLVNFVVKDQSSLRKRNEVRGLYLKIPFPLDFRVYFFNVTNPMEVQSGSKPILKQVGPYCYDEHKNKINVVDNDAEDSLQYDGFDMYQFNKNRSGNLSDEDYVTIINPVLVGMVNKVADELPALLSILNQAIGTLFKNPQSIYLTDKVKNILFDGIEINCQGTNFASKAICTQLRSHVPGIKVSPTQKNVLLLSLLGPRNATIARTVKIMRGIKNNKDLGRLLEIDGKKQITLWGSDKCNRYRGTDGWIIPPLLDPDDGIQAFIADLCRNMELNYIKDDVLKGIHVRRYEGNFGDQTNNEDDKCYCPSAKRCLKKGLFGLSKCLGAPVFISLPHFLDGDESLQSEVTGLNPVRNDHALNINIEPMTSAPINVKIRAQISIEIGPQSKITVMQNLPVALHPMFWIEDGVDLEGPLFTKLYIVLVLLKMSHVMRWIFLVSSLAVVAYGYFLHFKNKKSVKITPIHHISSAKDNDGFVRSNKNLMAQLRNETSNERKGYSNNNNNNNNNIMSGHEFDRYE